MAEMDFSPNIKDGHTTSFTTQICKKQTKSDCERNTLFTNSKQLSEEPHISCDEIVPSGTNAKRFKNTRTHTNSTCAEVHISVDTSQNASAIQPEERSLIDKPEKETDKNVESTMKQKILKQFKQVYPHILQLVIIGLVCYLICNQNGASHMSKRESTFVNLNVNFDLYSVETTSGKIPWRPIDVTFVVLEGNGTKIYVRQPGSYSIDVTLNFDNRRNKDQVTVSVCILNSRDTGNRCIPEVLSSHMQRSVTASVNLNLQKSDAIWVSVIGLNLVYQRADVNSMSIRKYDT
ncbi:uncharacterized protein [Mytilus edulis]|uniref:uncharacterized protein n=1 Tax=Mytilus edulis TaxID=6550 RepID=UPI0039F0D68A